MKECDCGAVLIVAKHVEMPLFETGLDDAIVKTTALCPQCLKVSTIDIAFVPSSTVTAHV